MTARLLLARSLGFVAALALAACSGDRRAAPEHHDADRPGPRKIDPPPGKVRPVPPHAIDPGGVGPYRLGLDQAEVFAILPSIPRVALLDVEGVLDASVIRTEEDTVLIGGRPGEVISFIGVIAPGVARTDGGVGVGSTRAELEALGPPLAELRVARDPRVFVPARLPGARIVLENDRVAAILLRALPGARRPGGPAEPADGDGEAGPDDGDTGPADRPREPGTAAPPEPPAPAGCAAALPPDLDVATVAGVAPTAVVGACLAPGGPDAIVVAGDTIVVVDLDGPRPRRIASIELRGLVWAAPIRVEGDRDEIVAVTERRSDDELAVSVVALRLEGGRLVKSVEEPAYRLTRTRAQWIGARLDDLRLLLAVEARPEALSVGGTLLHAVLTGARDVAPLRPVTIPRRRRAAADPGPEAGADGLGPARDAGVRDAGGHGAADPDDAPDRDAGP